MYVEIGLMERHHSTMQFQVRALASTWLLAAFAGLGFILTNKLNITLPVEWVVMIIGFFAFTGLLLLWVLDLLILQRLLDAAYIEGLELEKRHRWLPGVRTKARVLLKGKGLPRITLFYIVAVSMPLLIMAVSFDRFYIVDNPQISYLSVPVTLIVVVLLATVIFKFSASTPKLQDELKQAIDKIE
jgi:hypothetical protein